MRPEWLKSSQDSPCLSSNEVEQFPIIYSSVRQDSIYCVWARLRIAVPDFYLFVMRFLHSGLLLLAPLWSESSCFPESFGIGDDVCSAISIRLSELSHFPVVLKNVVHYNDATCESVECIQFQLRFDVHNGQFFIQQAFFISNWILNIHSVLT